MLLSFHHISELKKRHLRRQQHCLCGTVSIGISDVHASSVLVLCHRHPHLQLLENKIPGLRENPEARAEY